VDEGLTRIMSQLANAGVRMDVHRRDSHTELFVAELPSGKRYLFSKTGLLKLRDKGKLSIPRIEEFGVMR